MDKMTYCDHCKQPLNSMEKSLYATTTNGAKKTVCCTGCQQALQMQSLNNDTSASDRNSDKLKQKITETAVIIKNIHCSGCSLKIEKALYALTGVESFQVNPVTGHGVIHWDSNHLKLSLILKVLKEIGYVAVPLQNQRKADSRENRQALKRLIVAGFGMMQVMMYAVGLYSGTFQGISPQMQSFLQLISMLVTTPIVFYSGKTFYSAAWNDLSNRHIGMDVPVALAISIAYGASVWATLTQQATVYYDSVTMFIFFLLLGRYAEMKARHHAGAVNEALLDLLPATATRIADKKEELVMVSQLKRNDMLLIKPGATIPVDCIVFSGNSRVDESLLTGESTPLVKTVGDTLIAGSINYDNLLHVQVDKVGENTILSNIIRLLERAQREKPRISLLADKVAAYFVISILIIALLVGISWWFIEPGTAVPAVLAVLVVTCPCALSLATPTALTVAAGQLAKTGLLITRANVIEALVKVNHFIFDKTGTLTFGYPRITRLHNLSQLSDTECLDIAISLEQYSEHPIAKAFQKDSQQKFNITAIKNSPGKGIEGHANGQIYRIGTADFINELNHVEIAQLMLKNVRQANNTSYIFLGDATKVLAIFELTDTLRAEVKTTIKKLKNQGFNIEILSGDCVEAVKSISEQLGIDGQARLTPDMKLSYIRELQKQGKNVVMVGDGINDAPVLSAANVSIAMSSGTSLAQTTADMVLIKDSLQALPNVFSIAHRTVSIIRQNIAWAILYNLTALPLAATGMLPPWAAAIGMSSSSLLVVLNALRISKKSHKKINRVRFKEIQA